MFAGRLAIPKQAHGPSQRLLDQPHTHTNTSSYSTLPDLTSTMFATQAVHSGMPTGKKYVSVLSGVAMVECAVRFAK